METRMAEVVVAVLLEATIDGLNIKVMLLDNSVVDLSVKWSDVLRMIENIDNAA